MTSLTIDWFAALPKLLPMLLLIAGGILVMIADLWWPKKTSRWSKRGAPEDEDADRTPLLLFGILTIIVAMVAAANLWNQAASAETISMMVLDRYSLAGGMIVLGTTLAALAMGWGYLGDHDLPIGEYTQLLLFAGSGAWCMIASTNLLLMFVGLEILSIAAYVLAGMNRRNRFSVEAGLKYFLMGAVASGFVLFGITFLYGSMGSFTLTDFITPGNNLPPTTQLYLILGTGFFLVGLGFKVALAPFHTWAPDVYEGAPLPVTAYFATAVKTAAFLLFARVMFVLIPLMPAMATQLVAGLAIATMFVGNLAALWQDNMKRLLAYSSIAHAGYAALAFVIMASNPNSGIASLVWYLLSYSVMTIGAFAVLELLGKHGEEVPSITSMAGLGERHPWLAALLSLFLLSLAGFPPTIGFVAKYYLFSNVVAADHVGLVIAAVISSLISVGYYVHPIVVMYFRPTAAQAPRPISGLNVPIRVVIFCSAVAVLVVGILPSDLLNLIQASVLK